MFDGLPSAFYLPAGRTATVASGTGGPATTIAIATAPTRPEVSSGLGPVLIRPAEIRLEVRGAGRSTRLIRHVIAPDFPGRPPAARRGRDARPATGRAGPRTSTTSTTCPARQSSRRSTTTGSGDPRPGPIQRVYRPEGSPLGPPRDGLWAVRDGDVVLVTDGYHPFAATDADDAYYLNALAGDRRTMACSFDPALDDVRERWASEATDPRIALMVRAG